MSDDHDSPFVLEELPEAQWDAVENAVFAELEAAAVPRKAAPTEKTPEARSLWAFASVAALSAAAAVVIALSLRGTSPEAVSVPTSSMRFQGGPEGAALALEDVSLGIGANAEGLAAGSSERGWVVALETGRVEFAVAPRRDRPSFVVQAAGVRVEVVGTRFFVDREDERVEVAVMEGVVRVIAAGRVTELRAGEEWTTHPESHTETPPADHVVEPEANDPTAEPPDRTQTPEPLLDASLYERAAALEAENPAQAVRMYRRLARGGGGWAEAALFAQGRLEVEMGRKEASDRSLRRYLQRYPRGVNAQDARSLLED